MADVSKIKLPDGTTYNIKDTASGYTKNTGTITKVQTTAGTHTTINVSSGAASFNVPTKTSHLTNDSGFLTSVANDSHSHSPETIYIPANYARTGSVDLFSATKIGSYMSNKSFAIPPEAITIEYSTNGGSTWQDYGATDLHKRGLFAETRNNCNTYLGKATTKEANSLNNQLRITISRINLGRYTAINSFYTWMSTNGNTVYCKLERSLNSSPTVFETVFTDFKLSGWSGHNIRYFPVMALGGGNNDQPYAIRLTVWQTAITTNYPSANLYDIRFYGPDTYSASAPYYKVQTNELYTWDNTLNAIFPAGITATSFSGSLIGNVTGNVSGTASNVTGTVAIANGGTGQTTAGNAINALLNGLPTWTANPTDTTYFIRQDTGGSAVYGKVQSTTLWNYISEKLPAWSKASTKPSYNFSEIGSTPTTLSGYGITDAKIASGTITLGSNTITPLTSSSTLSASKLSGAIPSAITATTQASTDNSTKIATTAYVTTAIANLPEPMVFKGSVGTGGTITSLPTAAASNEGHTYKVITELSSPSAKVGDTVISNGSSWIVIPSGDEPSGTVTSVGISNGGGLSVSGSPITSSGTITISHADTSSQASSSNSGRTYIQSITLDTYGHITGISTATETVTNTDTKLQVAAVTSGTTYYPIVGTGTTAATRQYDTTGFVYVGTNGTTSAVGSAKLTLGNSTAGGTANNKQGQLIIYGSTAYAHTISGAPTAARTLTLPDATGTVALTSNIPDVSGKIDTAGTGLSKSGTTLNHSNSVTAQTTQAIYPIKIDAQGHISSYGTAVTPLTSHQTIKQDAVTGATGNHYASCTTAAGTAAKTASITAGTPALEAGLRVSVKFSNANTAGTPTLNINSLGAKNIFHKGAQITTGSNKALLAGLVDFIYDGTQWHLVGNYLDTNTTYTASTTSIGSASAGTAISADDITAWTTNTPTAVTKKTVVTSASGATAAVSNGVLTLTDGSFGTGDSVTVTAGTAASLSYTSRSIPNISVTSKTVATGITAN